MTVLVNRRLLRGKWRELDDLLLLVEGQGVPLLVLFPGPGVLAACWCWQEVVATQVTSSAINLRGSWPMCWVWAVVIGQGLAPDMH